MTHHPPASGGDGWALVGIAGLAVATRLAVMWVFEPTAIVGDEGAYYASAGRLAGEGLGWMVDPAEPLRFGAAPGGPVLQGLWAMAWGSDLRSLRLLNVFAGSVLAVVCALLGQRLGDASTGRAAGMVVALHPTLVGYSMWLWVEPLFLVPAYAALVALSAEGAAWWRRAALAGAWLGVATLVRETAVLLVLVGLGWAAARAARGLPGAGRGALAAALVFTVLVAPWSWRLNQLDGPTRFLSTTNAWNLLNGNTKGGPTYWELEAATRTERDEIATALARQAILERMPAWPFEKVVETAPRTFSARTAFVERLVAPKSSPWRLAGRWSWLDGDRWRRVTAAGVMSAQAWMVALGGAGLWLAAWAGPRRTRALAFALWAYVLLVYVPTWISFGKPRFGLGATPAFALGFAWLATQGAGAWRRARGWQRAVAGGVCVGLFALMLVLPAR